MKSFLKRVKKSPIPIALVLLLILLSFNMVNKVIKTNLSNEANMTVKFNSINKDINTMIYKTIKRDADRKVKDVSVELRKELIETYGNKPEEFIKHYDESNGDSEFIKILNNTLKDEKNRFFYVKNDDNDIYIISPKEVLADKSKSTCTNNKDDRVIKDEINRYPNLTLSKNVFKKILNGRNDDLFLQIKGDESTYGIEEVKYLEVMNLPLEDLKNFEFLSISYIDEYGDILGTPDVDKKGKKQNSRKIIIIQSFNLWDQMQDLGLMEQFNSIKNSQENIITNHQIEREYNSLLGILIAIIFIFSFIVMACLKNNYIRERDKSEC